MQQVLAVMYREYKIRVTSWMWLFFDLLVPFIYMLFFGLGFNHAFAEGVRISGMVLDYNSFFLPSVLAMACFGIAINTSYGFFVDRDNGIFYEFLTYPMTRGEFLVGKVTFNCITSVVQAIIAVLLGIALLDVRYQIGSSLLVVAGVAIGTAGWFFFLAIFALRIRRNDMFNTILNILYFVLLFVSSLFYPLDDLPAWFRWSAYCNPVTWQVDVLRYLMTGVGNIGIVGLEAAGFLIFLLVSFWLAVKTLRGVAG